MPFVIKLRGLPWSCTVHDIKEFLEPIEPEDADEGVHLLTANDGSFGGKFNGEALVELKSEEDMEEALKKNKEHMGKRYVEVFQAKEGELEYRCGPEFHPDDCIVKLRGLPYGSTKDDIYEFFKDLEIMPNGLVLATDPRGKTTGEAFVQFKTVKITEKALQKHKEHMGKRYIEVFKSTAEQMFRNCAGQDKPPSLFECNTKDFNGGFNGNQMGSNRGNLPFNNNNSPMGNNMNFMNKFGPMGNNGFGGPMNNNMFGGPMNNRFGGSQMNNNAGFGGPMNNNGTLMNNRMAPYDRFNRPNRSNNRGSDRPKHRGGSCIVHMRGLPFRATEDDVMEFFQPLETVKVEIGVGEDGRASGKASVEFRNNADATDAMSRNRKNMQHRYIELFLEQTGGEEDFVQEEPVWDMKSTDFSTSAMTNRNMGHQGMGNQGMGNQGIGNHGMGNQGMGNQGIGNQGMGNQGIGNQGMGNQGMGNQGMGNQSMGNNGSVTSMEMMSNMMAMMKNMIGSMGGNMKPEMIQSFQKMAGNLNNMGGGSGNSNGTGGYGSQSQQFLPENDYIRDGDNYGDRHGGGKMKYDRKTKIEANEYTTKNQYGDSSSNYAGFGVKSEPKYSDKSQGYSSTGVAVVDANRFNNDVQSKYSGTVVPEGFSQASGYNNQGIANTAGSNQVSAATGYSNASGYNQSGNISGYNQSTNSLGYNQSGNNSGYIQGSSNSGYSQGGNNSGYSQSANSSGNGQSVYASGYSGSGAGYNQGGSSSYSQASNETGNANTCIKSELSSTASGYGPGSGYIASSSATSSGYSGNWSTGGNVRSSWQ